MIRVVLSPHPTESVASGSATRGMTEGRMEISWHPEEGLVIVSLWHGSICRATFRLPVEQAPALIQTLADAQGDAVPATPSAARSGQQHPCSIRDESK